MLLRDLFSADTPGLARVAFDFVFWGVLQEIDDGGDAWIVFAHLHKLDCPVDQLIASQDFDNILVAQL